MIKFVLLCVFFTFIFRSSDDSDASVDSDSPEIVEDKPSDVGKSESDPRKKKKKHKHHKHKKHSSKHDKY